MVRRSSESSRGRIPTTQSRSREVPRSGVGVGGHLRSLSFLRPVAGHWTSRLRRSLAGGDASSSACRRWGWCPASARPCRTSLAATAVWTTADSEAEPLLTKLTTLPHSARRTVSSVDWSRGWINQSLQVFLTSIADCDRLLPATCIRQAAGGSIPSAPFADRSRLFATTSGDVIQTSCSGSEDSPALG